MAGRGRPAEAGRRKPHGFGFEDRRRGMKKIGIIGAMEEEIAYLKERMEDIAAEKAAGLEYFHGRLGGTQAVLVMSGIGKVNAAVCTQAMIDRFGVDCVINTGVAGGLADGLHIGDFLISTDAVQHDMDTTAFGDPVGVIPRMAESCFKADGRLIRLAEEAAAEAGEEYRVLLGRVASGDQFISTEAGREKIRRQVQGDCAEMEGAAIAQACWLNQVPFVIIRAISDDASEKAEISFEQFSKTAARRSGELVEKMLLKIGAGRE